MCCPGAVDLGSPRKGSDGLHGAHLVIFVLQIVGQVKFVGLKIHFWLVMNQMRILFCYQEQVSIRVIFIVAVVIFINRLMQTAEVDQVLKKRRFRRQPIPCLF